ncbi:uncharacterized protein LOC143909726 [Arctopsyche grandis]|uniref:uncharacterized protein LOC143909726 n=1 Tax=Arctopsyche grandis TaxID=121162 RepID=UPI00406D8B53
MSEEIDTNIIDLPHHHQFELCRTRPAYRQGRRLTAVKAYTINNESSHILVFGVPKINLRQELKQLLQKYGKIKSLSASPIYPTEQFTECYHVNYENFQSARIAKKFVDMRSFYGGILHICYAPELETIEQTRQKLKYRMLSVKRQLNKHNKLKKPLNYISNINNSAIENVNAISKNNVEVNSSISNGVIFPSVLSKDYNSSNFQIENSVTASFCQDHQNQNILEVSSNSNECTISKRLRDDEDYVFKRKKKKKLNKKVQKMGNSVKILENSSNGEQISNKLISPQNEDGKVEVFQNIEKPVIINIPKKVTNKIIMKIHSKLI